MDASQLSEDVLRGWLAEVPRVARQRILADAHTAAFPAGAHILVEGEPADRLGIVLSGRVALQLHVPGQGAITIETAEVGEVFGLSALVPPNRATATVASVGPVEALLVDAAALRASLEQDCELAAAVYVAVARALLRRLTAAHEMLTDLYTGPQPNAR